MNNANLKGATQTKEAYAKLSAVSTEIADSVKDSSSTALKGAQEYSNKFLEFAQANTNAAFDFAQRVSGTKSPSEFMELLTEHARTQAQTLTEQTKQLMELAQRVAVVGAKPLQEGVAKAFGRTT